MSDPVTCERCGKPGDRAIGTVSPPGWFFGCFKFDEEGSHDPGDFLVVNVCSLECRDAMWTASVGQTWEQVEHRGPLIADEIRRVAQLHIARLESDIKRISFAASKDSASTKVVAVLMGAIDAIRIESEHQVEWLAEDHP